MSSIDVLALNRGHRLTLVDRGGVLDTLEVTNLFDLDGDDTDSWETAVMFVAGHDDCWVACPVDDFFERAVMS